MAGITLAQAEEQLAAWLAASTATANYQSYSIAGRTLTRADAEEIRANIEMWNKLVISLDRGGVRIRGITPQ